MKQFIVMVAILPLLMVFIMQYGIDQTNHSRQLRFEETVHNAKLVAEREGGFDAELRADLIAGVARIYGVPQAEVFAYFNTETQGDRTYFTYQISAPIKKIIAGNKLFGISDRENMGRYTLEGKVLDISETPEAPDPEEAIPAVDPK
jgi:hypothetical protein